MVDQGLPRFGALDTDDQLIAVCGAQRMGQRLAMQMGVEKGGDDAPVYGRCFQTPFSDKVRQEADMPTMTET